MLKNVIRIKKESANQWIPKVETGKGPKYLQIVASLEAAIASGTLRPGDILPAQRQLAQLLDIDLTTVTRAYAEARERFLIQTRSGKGTFITDPESRLSGTIDLSMNIPPPPFEQQLNQIIQDNMSMLLNFYDSHALLTYHNTGGNPVTRQIAAEWLSPVLHFADPARTVMSPGAQSALSAAILQLTHQHDYIMAEPCAYPGFLSALTHLQRRVHLIETDAEGPVPESIIAACHQGIRVLYLNPTINNPTTVTISARRRQEIANIMNRYHLYLIEDDPYYLLAEDAPPPIACLAPQFTFYISTLSKTLAPGFQVAYNVLPDASACDAFCKILHSLSIMASPLMSALATHLIRSGQAGDILNGVKEESHQRVLLAKEILHLPEDTPANTIHLWYPLASQHKLDHLMDMARHHHLAVVPSSHFSLHTDVPPAIRISLGAVNSRASLAMALHTLSMLIQQP